MSFMRDMAQRSASNQNKHKPKGARMSLVVIGIYSLSRCLSLYIHVSLAVKVCCVYNAIHFTSSRPKFYRGSNFMCPYFCDMYLDQEKSMDAINQWKTRAQLTTNISIRYLHVLTVLRPLGTLCSVMKICTRFWPCTLYEGGNHLITATFQRCWYLIRMVQYNVVQGSVIFVQI